MSKPRMGQLLIKTHGNLILIISHRYNVINVIVMIFQGLFFGFQLFQVQFVRKFVPPGAVAAGQSHR